MTERKWRLTSKRSLDENGNLLPHDVSRHGGDGQPRFNPKTGSMCKPGTTFPRHVRRGDIKKISKIAQDEYNAYRNGIQNNVVEARDAGGALELLIKLGKFGVSPLGVFVRDNEVATVFPQEASGKNRLGFNGKHYKKSPK